LNGAHEATDGFSEIITAAGVGAPGGHIKVFDGETGSLSSSFFAYDPSFTGGVYVAGAAQIIPEPQSAALLLLGLVLIGIAHVTKLKPAT
jgi:hypothetical protein